MSEIKEKGTGRVVVRNYFDELCFVLQQLQCDIHGDGWHITDSTSSDYCIKCLKSMADDE